MGAVANLLVLAVSLESQLARIHLDQLGAHRHLPLGVAPKCLTCTSKPTVVCPPGKISLDAGTLHKGDHRWRGQHDASQQSGVSKCAIWVIRVFFGPTLGVSGLLSTPDTFQ